MGVSWVSFASVLYMYMYVYTHTTCMQVADKRIAQLQMSVDTYARDKAEMEEALQGMRRQVLTHTHIHTVTHTHTHTHWDTLGRES